MKLKNLDVCRIGAMVLGLLLVGSGWSRAGDRDGGGSEKMAAQIKAIAAGLGFKFQMPESVTLPQPAFAAPAQESSNVDFPWNAAKAEKAFEKARGNVPDENKLLGRWEQVARANNDNGYYNPQKKGGVLLNFSSIENPFDDGKRSSVVVVIDAESLMKTVSFEIRAPSVFFSSQRRIEGPSWVHAYEDGFECRLVDESHLICKRSTTGRSAYLTWMGFARLKR